MCCVYIDVSMKLLLSIHLHADIVVQHCIVLYTHNMYMMYHIYDSSRLHTDYIYIYIYIHIFYNSVCLPLYNYTPSIILYINFYNNTTYTVL